MAARTIHPFPARMAPEIALDCIPEADLEVRQTILDPMCGSGTVLAVAAQRGHHAIGIDLDPLAILMTTVATSSIDTSRCEELQQSIVMAAKADRKRRLPWTDDETTQFAMYWFADDQRLQLSRLSRAISNLPPGPLRRLAEVSLSRLIITKAPKASLAADTSHSRPHRVVETSDYDVLAGFSLAFTDLVRLLDAREMVGTAEAHLGDCRELSAVTDSSVDMVVTSPPYLNAIDYMRGHKFALIWLGHTIPELRKIRSSSIGAERALSEPATAKANDLVSQIEDEASDADLLPKPILTRYAHDLLKFAQQMARVMKSEGRMVAVVGNSTLKGNFIRNDHVVEQALQHCGFTTERTTQRPLPENRRYLPINVAKKTSAITQRMRTETVLHMNAPTQNHTKDHLEPIPS